MNMDYKVFTNVCTTLGTLCMVAFSSWFLSWSPMAMVSIYWKDFGLCLMAWSAILFLLYFIFRKSSIALYFLATAAFVLLTGLCIFLFAPKPAASGFVTNATSFSSPLVAPGESLWLNG